jgi:hypothetical protein
MPGSRSRHARRMETGGPVMEPPVLAMPALLGLAMPRQAQPRRALPCRGRCYAVPRGRASTLRYLARRGMIGL